jgi:hypothetical protein
MKQHKFNTPSVVADTILETIAWELKFSSDKFVNLISLNILYKYYWQYTMHNVSRKGYAISSTKIMVSS